MSEQQKSTPEEVIAAYDQAWNEPDANQRRRLLERCWAGDGELVDPNGRFTGREEVLERLGGFRERFPGSRVEITSVVDEHHHFLRYTWTIVGADGSQLLDGVDFAELASDGRLRRVVMFFGVVPSSR